MGRNCWSEKCGYDGSLRGASHRPSFFKDTEVKPAHAFGRPDYITCWKQAYCYVIKGDTGQWINMNAGANAKNLATINCRSSLILEILNELRLIQWCASATGLTRDDPKPKSEPRRLIIILSPNCKDIRLAVCWSVI